MLRLPTIATLSLISSAGVFADSGIRIYGTADSGVYYQSTSAKSFSPKATDGGSVHGLKDGGLNSTLWGITGKEDLGGGYSMQFKLQGAVSTKNGKTGITDTAGVTSVFNQITSLGLSGPFGDLNLGRQVAPMAFALHATDVRTANNFGSIRTAWNSLNYQADFPGTTTRKYIGGLFESNAIVYTSPKFGGFSLMGEYTFGEAPGNSKSGSRRSAVLNYSDNNLNISTIYYAGYDNALAAGAAPTGKMDNRYVYLGGRYKVGGLSTSASISNGRNPARIKEINLDLFSFGLGYRFSPAFQITSSVFHIRDKNNSTNKSTLYSLGAEYQLSKRTTLYSEVGHVNNQGAMNQEIAFATPVAPGKETVTAIFGMRHTF